MRKAPRPCRYPRCPELTENSSGFCEKHKQADRRRYEQEREPAHKRGYTWTWHKLRAMYISRNPLCEECRENGRIREAEEVHHVRSIVEAPELKQSMDNLRSLCKSCHAAEHRGD